MDRESRLLKNLTKKISRDSVGFLFESRAKPINLSRFSLDSSKNLIESSDFFCQISEESRLVIQMTFFSKEQLYLRANKRLIFVCKNFKTMNLFYFQITP